MRLASRVFSLVSLHRLVAAGAAAVILALTVFAASPAAHDSLHDDCHAPHDDGCAVVLFANGLSLPLALPTLAAPECGRRGITAATAAEVFLVSPRYLRQPERGPPQGS